MTTSATATNTTYHDALAVTHEGTSTTIILNRADETIELLGGELPLPVFMTGLQKLWMDATPPLPIVAVTPTMLAQQRNTEWRFKNESSRRRVLASCDDYVCLKVLPPPQDPPNDGFTKNDQFWHKINDDEWTLLMGRFYEDDSATLVLPLNPHAPTGRRPPVTRESAKVSVRVCRMGWMTECTVAASYEVLALGCPAYTKPKLQEGNLLTL